MFKIYCRITEDLKKTEIDDPIYGGFELCINTNSVGYCPQRELFPGEEWFENIQYAILMLSETAYYISKSQSYEIPLLSCNLLRLDFSPKELIEVKCINIESEKIEWLENIKYDEFYDEVYRCIEGFLDYIKLHNKKLLKSRMISKICAYEKEINDIICKKKK